MTRRMASRWRTGRMQPVNRSCNHAHFIRWREMLSWRALEGEEGLLQQLQHHLLQFKSSKTVHQQKPKMYRNRTHRLRPVVAAEEEVCRKVRVSDQSLSDC